MKHNPSFIIPAEVHSDDFAAQAHFDAAPWFSQASKEDILALAACGWRGDYPADEVALYFNDRHNEAVMAVLSHVDNVRENVNCEMGFECSIDETAVRAWLAVNRPSLILPES